VAAAVAAVGGSAALGGTAFGTFLVANATVVATVATVAATAAYGATQRRKAAARARAAAEAGLQDRLVMTPTYDGARSRCYGRVRNVDGVLFKATRGTNKSTYTLFIAVAGHQVDGFEAVYFDDRTVTVDSATGYVTSEPYLRSERTSQQVSITLNGSGAGSYTIPASAQVFVPDSLSAVVASTHSDSPDQVLTSSYFFNGVTRVISVSGGAPGAVCVVSWQMAGPASLATSAARVRFYDGSPSQDVSTVLAPLFPGLITAQHRFAGIAGLLVDLEYSVEAFPSGVPNISAVFRGARVFDPRTSTTAWTENPALIARDWALHANGGACAAGDLNEASFTAAANACDVTTSFPVVTGTTSAALYACGIVCKTDANPWETFGEMVQAMAGKAGWAGGLLRVVAGVYRSPVATLTEDWVTSAADVQVIPEPPTEEAVNIVRPSIADRAQGYVVVPAPEVRAATYITADGRELPREEAFGGVTDTVHAQHVASVLMRDAREGLTAIIPCNVRAFQVELFDVLAVTLPRFGWSAKPFEVVDWSFDLSGGVVLTLKETAAAVYTVDSSFAVLDIATNTELPRPWTVAAMGALTVTSGTTLQDDGTPVTRMRVQWPAPSDASVTANGRVQVQYWPLTDGPAPAEWLQYEEPGNSTETTINGLKANTAYLVRARFVTALGVRSGWSVHALHVTASAPPPRWAALSGRPADADLLNSYQIIGQNLLQESDQNVAPRFRLDYNPNGATFDQGAGVADPLAAGFSTSNNVLVGNRAKLVFVRQANQNAAGVDIVDTDGTGHHIAGRYIFDARIPVAPGSRVAASVYGNGHRCAWRVRVIFYSAADAVVGSLESAVTFTAESNTNTLSLMQRPVAIGATPAGAAYAVLAVIKYNTRVVAPSDSYLFWGLPQYEVVASNAQSASPYSSGPVGAIGTEQIEAGAATALTASTVPFSVGQFGNAAHDRTDVELTRTWTNTTSRSVKVHVVAIAYNVSYSFNGNPATVTFARVSAEYSTSPPSGSGATIMIANAPPSAIVPGDAAPAAGGAQFEVDIPPGTTITANIVSRHGNTTSGSAMGGDISLSITAIKL
jgi:hypothetical protein